ncbi:DUF1616 domain-containing protein [Natrinema amylolyticum]|uniref:DUF1616 domain-containing protein n=1 Tax=Natrinema amylolyticum TaxID=2878679 RepID=UPI00299D1243|nr:DUF1616 domain-containing protein [Natrinema amylolyticum]
MTLLVNIAVFAPIFRETSLDVPLGFLFVFFVPGYVLVATLFPEADRSAAGAGPSVPDDRTASVSNSPWQTEIDGFERIVLSFGLSVAIVPGSALLLNYTPWGIGPVSLLAATTAITLLLTITATARRLRLSEEERFRVPVRGWLTSVRSTLVGPTDRGETVITVLLVASILLAVGGVGYAATTPSGGEQFSEVYLLSEDGDGELVAGEYPTEFERGERQELVVGIENNEHETVNYTTVVVEQAVESDGDDLVITDQQEIDRFETRLDSGETWRQEHGIEPTIGGENVRFLWLVYLGGDVPEDPSMENAAYAVHLWADVDESNGDP